MKRRTFLGCGLALSVGTPLYAALRQGKLDQAAEVLAQATASRSVDSAVLHVRQGDTVFNRAFGQAADENAMFLLGSISKPINMTAVMTLYDQGAFQLDDPVRKYLPEFRGEGREQVTVRQLMTHVSGLPDQLPENDALRSRHADLRAFVDQAVRTPLQFAPGTRYQYSSMAILLAARIAELLSGTDIRMLVDRAVLQPLGMKHSAQGLGRFRREEMVVCQTERAAPESGGGSSSAKSWDWNSPYWRALGAPWGGTHASAPDVGRFLAEFLYAKGAAVKPATARLMVSNQNPAGLTPRGLGFQIGTAAGSPGCSDRTFGHTGSTGTICWADPATDTICVVLTSLPGRALQRHPREAAAAHVAAAAGQE
ncbi:MAG: serine hydrolase domain-containing protein [Pirellulaceae bacterium]